MIRRRSHNKIGKIVFPRLLLLSLGLTTMQAVTPAQADTHSYASERRQIRACVLVTNAAPGVGGGPENVTPHVFYVMDRRTDLKPAGWEFTNPLAPSTITGDIYARWQNRAGATDPAFGGGAASVAFRVGAPLSKNFGAYWEVNLDNVSSTDLQQFDVVLMAYHNGSTQFNADEREKLRRYVDGGGTVWLEDEGDFDLKSGGSYGGGQFIVDLGFSSALSAGTYPTPATAHHPLINFPYSINSVDIQALGAAGIQYDSAGHTHHAHQGLNNTFTGTTGLANPRVLVPVVWAGVAGNQLPFLSAGDYGAGHIVVSSGGIATGINAYVGGVDVGEGGNSAVASGEGTLGARPVDLKFAYNLIAWTSSVPTGGVNARRTSGTQENVGSQLAKRWSTIPPQLQNPPQSAYPSVGSGAVIHKGVVFYVDGNNVLHAYDASPQQDLDNDGNSDDGIRDYIYGAPYDEIWNVDMKGTLGTNAGTRISTPTIISVANPVNGTPLDIIAVTTSTGATLFYDAFPRVGGVLQTTSPLLFNNVVSPDASPTDLSADLLPLGTPLEILPAPAPAFSDGVVFTLWNQAANDPNHTWHIAALDPFTGQDIFHESSAIAGTVVPSTLSPAVISGVVPGIANPVGSLTVGYVRDDATGALDKMIYVPTRTYANTDTFAGTVQGVWFSTKGEPLESFAAGSNMFVPKGTRRRLPWFQTAPTGPAPDLRPVVYQRFAGGGLKRLIYGTDFTVEYQGPPANRVMVVIITAPFVATDTFTADYTLDWPADLVPTSGGGTVRPTAAEMRLFSIRSFTVSPDPRQGVANPPYMRIFGTPTLSPQDYLFLGAGDYPGGDRLYAYHEQFGNTILNTTFSNGTVKANTGLAWMFSPNAPDDDFALGTGGVPGRLFNISTFVSKNNPAPPPVLTKVFVTDYEQIGNPAYTNGVVYTVGYCHLRDLNGGVIAGPKDGLVLMALRSNPDTTFTVQKGDGTLIALPNERLKIRQPDLVNSTALQPKYVDLYEDTNFTVDRSSSTIHIFDFRVQPGNGAPATGGDAFNTALPILVSTVNGTKIVDETDPIINHQTGFGVLDNLLWWATIPLDRKAFGIAPTSVTEPELEGIHPASGASVIGSTLYYGSTTGRIVSFDMSGISSNGGQVSVFKDDGTLRLIATDAVQYLAPGPPVSVKAIPQPIFSPPVATTGIVAVGTPQGLIALDNQLTLIADNNRLIEVDHAGRAAWTMDATQSYTAIQSTVNGQGALGTLKTSLSRPNMAHRYTLNDFLVADTGNNRVIEVDKGGIVTWELSRMGNDLRFLRDNDPVTLNQPTDIQTYTTSGTGTLTFTSPVSNATYSYTPPGSGFWIAFHYIIADSGNFRSLEVVDIYDATGAPVVMTGSDGTTPRMLKQVVFNTRSYGEQNQAFRYRTIQQFTNFESGVFRTYMVAAVDNVRQAGVLDPTAINVGTNPNDVKGPGGSLMILKRYPPAGAGADGDVAALINSIVYVNAAGTTITQRQTISNPRWFKEFNVVNPLNLVVPDLHYVLADANGVYVLKPGTGMLNGEAIVEWSLSNDDYYYMTGRHLNATSIQKLEQADYDPTTNKFYPRYLITNAYTGRDNIFEIFGGPANVADGDVHGEVVEVRSDYFYTGGYRQANARLYNVVGGNLTANTAGAITWMVPNEAIPVLPASGPIKRKIGVGTNGTATSLLEQPTFSDRPF